MDRHLILVGSSLEDVQHDLFIINEIAPDGGRLRANRRPDSSALPYNDTYVIAAMSVFAHR
jgi:hypothetical protein